MRLLGYKKQCLPMISNPINVRQYLRHDLIQFGRNFFAKIYCGERGSQYRVFINQNIIFLRFSKDLFRNPSLTACNHSWRSIIPRVILQRSRHQRFGFTIRSTRDPVSFVYQITPRYSQPSNVRRLTQFESCQAAAGHPHPLENP